MSTPEGKVKEKIKRWLKDKGAWSYMPVQNGMGVQGIPDHVACVPTLITPDMVGTTIGVFYGIEAKAPGKRSNTTANQKSQLAGIAIAHGKAIVVDDAALLDDDKEYLL